MIDTAAWFAIGFCITLIVISAVDTILHLGGRKA